MKTKNINSLLVIGFLLVVGCKNRPINEGEQFQPREIHQNIVWTFDNITVDGIDYLILQKDNNNPHEGFGFMALRGNYLFSKQDSIMAYLKAQKEVQTLMLSLLSKSSLEQADQQVTAIYAESLKAYEKRLIELRAETHSNAAYMKP